MKLAICSFQHSNPHAIGFKIGDRLELKEECDGKCFSFFLDMFIRLNNSYLFYSFNFPFIQKIENVFSNFP